MRSLNSFIRNFSIHLASDIFKTALPYRYAQKTFNHSIHLLTTLYNKILFNQRMTETIIEPVVEVTTKSALKVNPRDLFMLAIGVGTGWALKHYRNIYLEWKRKRLMASLAKTDAALGRDPVTMK